MHNLFCRIRENKLLMFMCSLLIVLSVCAGITFTAFAESDSSKDESLSSFSNMGAAFTAYLDYATAQKDSGKNNEAANDAKAIVTGSGSSDREKMSNVGNVGAFMGYVSGKDAGFLRNIINALQSTKSAEISYKSFDESSSMYAYCQYGALLSVLGLDSTPPAFSANNIWNFLASGIIMVPYLCAESVSVIFSWVLMFLQMINPFQFFTQAFDGTFGTGPEVDWAANNASHVDIGAFSGITGIISEMYSIISNISWSIIVPILIVMLVISLVFLQSSHNPQAGPARLAKIKNFAVRVVFIAVGIPILGCVYTSALDAMQTQLKGEGPADVLVKSTFVDFEDWAEKGHLAIPESSYSVDTNTVYYKDGNKSKENKNGSMKLKVNTDVFNTLKSFTYSVNRSYTDDSAMSMLIKFMTSERYTPSEYASAERQNTVKSTGAAGPVQAIMTVSDYEYLGQGVFSNISDFVDARKDKGVSALFGDTSTGVKGQKVELSDGSNEDRSDKEYKIFTNGGLAYHYDGLKSYYYQETDSNKTSNSKYGLSSLAMYNYLESTFDDGKVVIYSTEASNDRVQNTHCSVNLIGTGITSFAYWFNCASSLCLFAVLGLGYALSLMFGNFKRMFRLIASVPAAMFGVMKSIARVITYTVMMILEVFITMGLYSILCEFLSNFSDIFITPITKVLNTAAPGVIGVNGVSISNSAVLVEGATTMFLMATLFSSVVTIIFMIFALKLRKTVIKAFDELAEQIIEKFIIGQPISGAYSGGKQPGALRNLAGGIASGAGMAAGQRALQANGKPSEQKAVQGTSGGSGADGSDGADGSSSMQAVAGDAAMVAAGGSGMGEATEGVSMSTDANDKELGDSVQSASSLGAVGPVSSMPNPISDASEKGDEMADKATTEFKGTVLGEESAAEQEAYDDAERARKAELIKEGTVGFAKDTAKTAVAAAKVAASEGADVNADIELAKGLKSMGDDTQKIQGAGKQASAETTEARKANIEAKEQAEKQGANKANNQPVASYGENGDVINTNQTNVSDNSVATDASDQSATQTSDGDIRGAVSDTSVNTVSGVDNSNVDANADNSRNSNVSAKANESSHNVANDNSEVKSNDTNNVKTDAAQDDTKGVTPGNESVNDFASSGGVAGGVANMYGDAFGAMTDTADKAEQKVGEASAQGVHDISSGILKGDSVGINEGSINVTNPSVANIVSAGGKSDSETKKVINAALAKNAVNKTNPPKQQNNTQQNNAQRSNARKTSVDKGVRSVNSTKGVGNRPAKSVGNPPPNKPNKSLNTGTVVRTNGSIGTSKPSNVTRKVGSQNVSSSNRVQNGGIVRTPSQPVKRTTNPSVVHSQPEVRKQSTNKMPKISASQSKPKGLSGDNKS